ncbi:unnamed protein product [Dracunculus medinensis]|uniref:JmjC domain-containing protein n=1 Tax=Dracunculus medinensis TaxID=318479 RepID=A0A0N4U8C4_DRAME|nr:unnamed protein product [Dracunculus medinensis]
MDDEYKWHGPCIPSGSDLIPNVPHRNQKLETVEQSPENQGEMSGRRSRKRRRSEAIETALDQISEEFRKYVVVIKHPNGGASILATDWDEIQKGFDEESQKEFATQFVNCGLAEVDNVAVFAMGVVKNAMNYLSNVLWFMANEYPQMAVKIGSLSNKQEITTTTLSAYFKKVCESYGEGTFRYGPLHSISLVGAKKEECGRHCPRLIAMIESFPMFKLLMPWSELSIMDHEESESDDGPIFWVRPGEQTVPLDYESNASGSTGASTKRQSYRKKEIREIFFEDRTHSHCDHTGDGYPTAAVGFLQNIVDDQRTEKPIVKDVICFHANNFHHVMYSLHLDPYEPPSSQCLQWVGEAKLNQLRREGIKYTHLQLQTNDAYFIPRKVIHQFRTINACSTVAWHIRFRKYYVDGSNVKKRKKEEA